MRPLPPSGVPPKVRYKGKSYWFDRMAGTGEPVYAWVDEKKPDGERLHVIKVRSNV